jgi:5-methyltetrahydrofolate--homocysteine methyltransferase
VASSLLSPTLKEGFVRQVREEYGTIREQRAGRGPAERQVSLANARANRLALDWGAVAPPAPCAPGLHVLDDYPLADLVDRIDWTPFFQTWELAGHYPAILDDPTVGPAARSLFADARALLDRIVRERLLTARGVFGIFPAASAGDDIEVYRSADRRERIAVIHTLRQQMAKPPGRPNLALADYVAPRENGVADHIGLFAVTAGHGLDAVVAEFQSRHDDYNAILAKALADRLAEAFAERLHERVRREYWGYAREEALDNTELIREAYQGIRPAPGYPACPDHTEKQTLFELLQAERHAGIELTESFAMTPGAAVSGYYFWHPEARYFGVGRIGRDQVEDYARRKGLLVEDAERWLAPNLGYERGV